MSVTNCALDTNIPMSSVNTGSILWLKMDELTTFWLRHKYLVYFDTYVLYTQCLCTKSVSASTCCENRITVLFVLTTGEVCYGHLYNYSCVTLLSTNHWLKISIVFSVPKRIAIYTTMLLSCYSKQPSIGFNGCAKKYGL